MNIIDTLNTVCEYKTDKYGVKHTDADFFNQIQCLDYRGSITCNPCMNVLATHTENLVGDILCTQCTKVLIDQKILFKNINQVKQYLRTEKWVCEQCSANLLNIADLIKRIDKLDGTIKSLDQRIDELTNKIRIKGR